MAIANSPVRVDALLCLSTPDETEALLANLRGDPDIYHPPTFMKETMPVGHRAIVEQFHEAHIEATLTADVPSCVPLRKNMSHEAVDLKVAADAWASAAATDPGIGTMVQATVWLRVLELDGEMDTQRRSHPSRRACDDAKTRCQPRKGRYARRRRSREHAVANEIGNSNNPDDRGADGVNNASELLNFMHGLAERLERLEELHSTVDRKIGGNGDVKRANVPMTPLMNAILFASRVR
ncbi:hypothetical protein PC120_g12944 [Phytophthora cactorum]|nr:hypothetical protein PC120_g12944 [Phytophthora cactorum]